MIDYSINHAVPCFEITCIIVRIKANSVGIPRLKAWEEVKIYNIKCEPHMIGWNKNHSTCSIPSFSLRQAVHMLTLIT